MTTPTPERLSTIPNLDAVMRRILVGSLPVVGTPHAASNDPHTRLEVTDVTVDPTRLAAYTAATGLRLSDTLPPTYLYVLTFPVAMELMSRADFPFAPAGTVHVANEVTQTRAVTIDERLTVRVHGEKLRPHRKGLLVDIVTEVTPASDPSSEPVWRQVSTFLGQGQKFSKDAPVEIKTRGLDDARRLGSPAKPRVAANSTLRVSRETVRGYVDASGDKNPIHTSALGAKLFGFPNVIAHGMYSAAAVLRLLEGKLDRGLTYRVEFYKPLVVPARASLWVLAHEDDPSRYSLQLRKASKPETLHLNAQVELA